MMRIFQKLTIFISKIDFFDYSTKTNSIFHYFRVEFQIIMRIFQKLTIFISKIDDFHIKNRFFRLFDQKKFYISLFSNCVAPLSFTQFVTRSVDNAATVTDFLVDLMNSGLYEKSEFYPDFNHPPDIFSKLLKTQNF